MNEWWSSADIEAAVEAAREFVKGQVIFLRLRPAVESRSVTGAVWLVC